jgi:hypothetical protein
LRRKIVHFKQPFSPTDRKIGRYYISSPFSEKTKVNRKIANTNMKDEQKSRIMSTVYEKDGFHQEFFT